jgi:hypothetical protein
VVCGVYSDKRSKQLSGRIILLPPVAPLRLQEVVCSLHALHAVVRFIPLLFCPFFSSLSLSLSLYMISLPNSLQFTPFFSNQIMSTAATAHKRHLWGGEGD